LITIDGSEGEGGGQVLRTSLSLSLVTGEPFRIKGIRAGRKRPGLLRQHLTAVQAATAVGKAEVRGAKMGSPELLFRPSGIAPGDHSFSVGTAGSATLVLQTVLPALLTADGPSRITVEGGTHNPFAPPYDFLEKTFLPLVERMGPRIKPRLDRHGFFPAGGGKIRMEVDPVPQLEGFHLLETGEIRRVWARAIVSRLPWKIAHRELAVIRKKLDLEEKDLQAIEVERPRGPGNVVMIGIESEALTETVTAFGEKGVRAETVAKTAAAEARAHMESGAPVGRYLADQLLIPFALAGGGRFLTRAATGHTRTNIGVIQKFLDVPMEMGPQIGDTILISIGQA
jgi:RNA 3'-terminal phosphate cyclase (ATP)